MKGRLAVLGLLIPSAVMLFSACTPEKARSLRIAAVQFKIEALAAIDALETMEQKVTAAPPRSESDADREFVKNVLEFKGQALGPAEMETMLDPLPSGTNLSLASNGARYLRTFAGSMKSLRLSSASLSAAAFWHPSRLPSRQSTLKN